MMRCPLPIDWLEYLEGAHSDELAAHLPTCLPCQVLVEELQREGRPQLRPARLPKPDIWPHWREAEQTPVAFGEIRWTTASLPTTRTPVSRVSVLVLSNLWEEKGCLWCDVVPVSTDIENSTSLDLTLRRSDTNMGIPLRVLFRYQTVADARHLDHSIGSLTQEGGAVVRDALMGRASDERFGSPIESSDDPRVAIPEELGHTLRIIGQRYAQTIEAEDASAPFGRILTFEMRRASLKRASAAQTLSLAASTDTEQEKNYWVVEIPERGHIEGRVDHRYAADELLFVISEVLEEKLGLGMTAWISAWVEGHETLVRSEPFRPVVNRQVLIGRGLGVFPPEILRMQLRLVDETQSVGT
jgi:hypothetical protein